MYHHILETLQKHIDMYPHYRLKMKIHTYISCIHQRIVKLPWIPWIWSINCKNPTVLDASTEKMMVFSAMFLTEEIFPKIAFLSLPETYGWGVAIKSRSSVLWSLQDFWEPKSPGFFLLRDHTDSISINAWDLSFSRMRRMEAKETVGPTIWTNGVQLGQCWG